MADRHGARGGKGPVPAVVLGLSASLISFVALASQRSETYHYTGNPYVALGARLYFIEHHAKYESHGPPSPDKVPEKLVSQSAQIVELDLGSGRSRHVGDRISAGNEGLPLYTLLLDERHAPSMHTSAEIDAMVKKAMPKPCNGEIRRNVQDWRVLHFHCKGGALAFRLDWPFDRAIPIRLGAGGGMPGEKNFELFSVAGDPHTYARSDTDKIYEIDTAAGAANALRLDIDSQRARWLVGISSSVRIFITRSEPTRVSLRVERRGEELRTFTFDHASLKPLEYSRLQGHELTYVAACDCVVWSELVRADDTSYRSYVSLNLRNGTFQKADFRNLR